MSLLDFAKDHISLFIPDHEPDMLYDYEIEVLTHINDNKLSTIIKSRQVGMSSLYALYIAWLCMCQPFVISGITLINGYHSVREILLTFLRKWDGNSYSRNLTFNSNNITFYGIKINFIQGDDMVNSFKYDSNVIIIDEAVMMNNHALTEAFLYIYHRFTHMRKISVASTLNGDHFFNDICTNSLGCNYILHYSQSPFWELKRLEYIANRYDKKWWNESMDCKSIIDDNGFIMLRPYKSKKVLKIENEILKQLENYD